MSRLTGIGALGVAVVGTALAAAGCASSPPPFPGGGSAVVPSSLSPSATPVGPGTASLAYSGVLSGPLVDAVSYCYPLPSIKSEIAVNGNLDGTPWVLLIQSFYGEGGVWQVFTGQAGGGPGQG
jgi:hypothetical protein